MIIKIPWFSVEIISCLNFSFCHDHKINAVANAPVPVTTDMNIKVPVNLKLQARRHTDTLTFTSIHLMYLMIHFLFSNLKK